MELAATGTGKPAHRPDAEALPATRGSPAFELDSVNVEIEGHVLLHPLTLAIETGRVCGLIGHNGSGKTTLLKALARQVQITSGGISFEDRPLEGWSTRDFARHVAYLPQQTPPADGLTVAELVALGRYPWHGALGRFGPQDQAKTEEAMRLTGVAPFAERLVDTLSGGERQRVWLAMLVAQDARCMLLDEPISALDVAHQVEVADLVRRLCEEKGLTIVIVLHDVNMAARICHEILALQDGRLIAHEPAHRLMDGAVLERIYGVPMGIFRHPVTGAPISYVK